MLERVDRFSWSPADSWSPANPWSPGRALDFGRQLALIVGAAVLYFAVRGRTEGSEALAVANGLDLLALERSLGLDVEAGLQALILPHQWAVTMFNWIYIWGHWPVIAATLVWLYRTRRVDYLLLRNALFLSGAIGLVIFVFHPVAPPRLLPSGFVDTVTELSTSYRVLQPPSLVNKYAALPSLHVGWNLLIGVAVFRTGANRWARVFGVVSPMAMVAAVVLTGNHYLVDAILGAVVALIGLALAWRLTRGPTAEGRAGAGYRSAVGTDPRATQPATTVGRQVEYGLLQTPAGFSVRIPRRNERWRGHVGGGGDARGVLGGQRRRS